MSANHNDLATLWTALGAGLIVGMMLCSLVVLDATPPPALCPAGQTPEMTP